MSVLHIAPPNRANAVGRVYKSSAYEEKPLIRTGKGVLNGLMVNNKNASTVYIYVCDLATASGMAIGNTILPPIPVDKDKTVSVSDIYGIPFTLGLVVAASSTEATYTALGSNDVNMAVHYAIDTTTPTTDA